MKTDIILCGVGGQGILSIASAIGIAALEAGLNVKQAEVHGMSQRGGAVQSHLRLSDSPIASDLIPRGKADVILSVEPMEALRYMPFLSPNGKLFSNTSRIVNIPDYPEENILINTIKDIKNHVLIDAEQIAKDCGTVKASNMVMLGAAFKAVNISEEHFKSAISKLFGSKGEEIVDLNLNAFAKGAKATRNYLEN